MRGVTNPKIIDELEIIISTHTPHARRDRVPARRRSPCSQFQLTRLMRGVTVCVMPSFLFCLFQLTRLMRGVTSGCSRLCALRTFQLTRLMRGVTLALMISFTSKLISTHTPHARRDTCDLVLVDTADISTHTPHARRDSLRTRPLPRHSSFQLTRLMRGVTQTVLRTAPCH